MADKKVFNIDRLRDQEAGRITVDGAEHLVRQITGGTYQALKAADVAEGVEVMQEAVRTCVPTLDEKELLKLNMTQLNAIITIAGAGVAAVEALFPNVESPETSTSLG